MDAFKTLPIKKHPSLIQRFPETRIVNPIERKRANWIVFGEHLAPQLFIDLDFYAREKHAILDIWQVGPYEVALMSGDLDADKEAILQELKIEYANIHDVPDLTQPGLIVMDMDSTAIQIECIDEIAKLAGVGDEVSAVTERAMQGELDFEQSLRLRVSKLKDADQSILDEVRSGIPFMPDLGEMVTTLQQFGWKTAIASGGFTYFSDHLKERLNLDFAQSNVLEIVNGKLTGQVLGGVVSAQNKADILQQLTAQYGIEAHNTVAIGDGANDLVMMAAAGLGIAYHAKPKVYAKAQASIRYIGLGGVLCILSAGLVKRQKLSWQAKP